MPRHFDLVFTFLRFGSQDKVTGAEEVVIKEVILFTMLKKPVLYETKQNQKQDSSKLSLKFSHDKNVLYLIGLWVIQVYIHFSKKQALLLQSLYFTMCKLWLNKKI